MTDVPLWGIYIPGFVIVIAGVVIFRWLLWVSRRLNEHAERIAHLEGRLEPWKGDDESG